MTWLISCKVLLALIICVSLGFEGVSASTIRRRDWETSEEDFGEEGQNLRTARSAEKYAIFSASKNGKCPTSNEKSNRVSSACYNNPEPSQAVCLKRLDECLKVVAYRNSDCRGEVVAYLDHSPPFSTPFVFTHDSLLVTDACRNGKNMESPEYFSSQERSEEVMEDEEVEEAPRMQLLKPSLEWFQRRELQRMERESRRLE